MFTIILIPLRGQQIQKFKQRRFKMQVNRRIQSRIQEIITGASALKGAESLKDSEVETLYRIRKASEEILEALPQCAVCQRSQGGLVTFGRGSGLEHLGRLCRPCAAAALRGEVPQAPKACKAGEKKGEGNGVSPAVARKKGEEVHGESEEEAQVQRVSEVSGLGLEEALKVVSIMEEAAIPLVRDSMIKNVQQEVKGEKYAETRFEAAKVEAAVTEYYRIRGTERIGGDPNRPRRRARR
jgi:hypothetical protein